MKVLKQLISSHQYEIKFDAKEPLDFNYQNDPHNWELKHRAGNIKPLVSHSISNTQNSQIQNRWQTQLKALTSIYRNTNWNKQIIVSTHKNFNRDSNYRVSICLHKSRVATSKLETNHKQK